MKEEWFRLVEPHVVAEGFGATENIGFCFIRGDEWIAHPGTVGRPYETEARILDADGRDLPAGEMGEIFMRRIGIGAPTFSYLGAGKPRTTDDGFVSLGDLGSLDNDGYLHVADRRVDLIITGGVNVYPAEVEAVLLRHPGVDDAVVIGLPDPEWGRRTHAVVQRAEGVVALTEAELLALCRSQLAAYKVPRSVEFADRLPRDAAGKIRRRAMVEEREAASP